MLFHTNNQCLFSEKSDCSLIRVLFFNIMKAACLKRIHCHTSTMVRCNTRAVMANAATASASTMNGDIVRCVVSFYKVKGSWGVA